jgi:molybdate transport system permease protein
MEQAILEKKPPAPARGERPSDPPPRSDLLFVLLLFVIGGSYLVLILALLFADLSFTAPWYLVQALESEEIVYSIKLSLLSCSVTAILSVWVAVPLGYVLARYRFWGKEIIDALIDIPVVLPPLVIGLSLLILFQTPPGQWVERQVSEHMGVILVQRLLPFLLAFLVWWGLRRARVSLPQMPLFPATLWLALFVGVLVALVLGHTVPGAWLAARAQDTFGTGITYEVPAVILAQFAVACAFAVRTMRVTFEQISPRREQVALTLGCSRAQAFWWVVLPEAWRGMITAGTLAWARALGEFGPILVFAGATRLRTEVLSSTVFLELSVGNLDGAVAVSLLMVGVALLVLLIVRLCGMGRAQV